MKTEKVRFRVVKTTVKTNCDLEREVIKSRLPLGKAKALQATLEAKQDQEEFDPKRISSYLIEPVMVH